MELLLRLILIAGLFLFAGCASLGIEPINFQDGSWSKCRLTMKDGKVRAFPLQLSGAPLEWEEDEGKVVCEGIPKAVPIAKEPEAK